MAGWRLWLPQSGNTLRLPAGARHYPPPRPQTRATPSGRLGTAGPAGAGSDFPRGPTHLSALPLHCGHKDTFFCAGAGTPSSTNTADAP